MSISGCLPWRLGGGRKSSLPKISSPKKIKRVDLPIRGNGEEPSSRQRGGTSLLSELITNNHTSYKSICPRSPERCVVECTGRRSTVWGTPLLNCLKELLCGALWVCPNEFNITECHWAGMVICFDLRLDLMTLWHAPQSEDCRLSPVGGRPSEPQCYPLRLLHETNTRVILNGETTVGGIQIFLDLTTVHTDQVQMWYDKPILCHGMYQYVIQNPNGYRTWHRWPVVMFAETVETSRSALSEVQSDVSFFHPSRFQNPLSDQTPVLASLPVSFVVSSVSD